MGAESACVARYGNAAPHASDALSMQCMQLVQLDLANLRQNFHITLLGYKLNSGLTLDRNKLILKHEYKLNSLIKDSMVLTNMTHL